MLSDLIIKTKTVPEVKIQNLRNKFMTSPVPIIITFPYFTLKQIP